MSFGKVDLGAVWLGGSLWTHPRTKAGLALYHRERRTPAGAQEASREGGLEVTSVSHLTSREQSRVTPCLSLAYSRKRLHTGGAHPLGGLGWEEVLGPFLLRLPFSADPLPLACK